MLAGIFRAHWRPTNVNRYLYRMAGLDGNSEKFS